MLLSISVLAFLTVVLLFWGLAGPLRSMEALAAGPARGNALVESPLGPLVRLLAGMNRRPALDAWCRSLEKRHVEAGQPGGRMTGEEFLAGAELAGLAVFVIIFGMTVLAGGVTFFGTLFALALGAACVWLVTAWLDGEVDARRRSISRQLPFFIDLATMCMDAGATFQETIEIYERDNPDDELALEFRIAMGEVRMGKTIAEGLEGVSGRVHIDVLRNFINAIVQGQKMGTPMVSILRDQAEVMRFKRSQDAERAAEELKIRIQGPVILMMISVFVLILAPAFLETLSTGVL